jgi:hypothetical protein
MNTPTWEAPRVAYLLTAAMADNPQQARAIVPVNGDINLEWGGYDEAAQQDILTALGAQTRLALGMLRERLGTEIEIDWESTGWESTGWESTGWESTDWESRARAACSHAFAAVLAAVRELVGPDPRARVTAQCAHCREVIAKAMCSLQIQAYFRLGFTPAMIAAMCRQSADEPQASPRHRETSIQSSALSRGHSPCEPNTLR